MPRIRCHYINCVFIDDSYCSAAAIEIDPDEGCMTYYRSDGITDDEWTDEEEIEEWDNVDDEDLWLDEDDF